MVGSILILPVAAQSAGSWTTSANVPNAFRPDRTVTITYAASSTNPADLPIDWFVDLHTCTDQNVNGYCSSNEPHYIAHGRKALQATAGNSATAMWSVSLAEPEGTRRYHISTICRNNPCLTEPAGGDHNKTGNIQLRYTNTWTRQIIATNPTTAGATQTIGYRLTSTSPDDRDLSGSAELFSRPPSHGESSAGGKPYTASANSITDLQWPNVAFPEIGTHRLRVSDTNAADATLDVTVRGVHLHVTQPRAAYFEGSRFSLYFTLEGHGATPDPSSIANADITLTLSNDTFPILGTTLRTDANGRAYANISAPHDATRLHWIATTSGNWNGVAYALFPEGFVDFTALPVASDHAPLEENITAIREDINDIQLKGVHLDDIGSRNAWMTSLRASGAVALVIILVLLVTFISFRV